MVSAAQEITQSRFVIIVGCANIIVSIILCKRWSILIYFENLALFPLSVVFSLVCS